MAMTGKGRGYMRIRGADTDVDRESVRIRIADYDDEKTRREAPRTMALRREITISLGMLCQAYLAPARAWGDAHEGEWAERLAAARKDRIAELQLAAEAKAKLAGIAATPVALTLQQETQIKREVLNRVAAERAETMARETLDRVGKAERVFRAALYEILHELPEFAGMSKA